jgi:altronate dehydratase small subunit
MAAPGTGDPSGPGPSGWDAVQLHPDDNVAVALRDLTAGQEATIHRTGGDRRILLPGAIAMGHKLALAPLGAGAVVLKYGASIGTLTADVAPGDHVHVHNLVSNRARAGG